MAGQLSVRSAFVAVSVLMSLNYAVPPGAAAQRSDVSPGETHDQEEQESAGRIELVDERTAHAKVYLQADGTKTTVISTEAVHYQTPDGRWKEIDNRLEGNPHGNGYVNRAGGNAFAFAEHAQAPALVSVGNGSGRFSFGIEGVRGESAVVDGNEISYSEVLPGVDVRLSLHGESLKEIVVLNAAPALDGTDLVMRFPLDLHALRATEESGGVILENPHGDVVFRIPKPLMFDSATHEPSGESAFSEDIRFDLEQGPGANATLVLTAEGEWLTDEARVYPVFLDPTVFGPNTPSVDTFVQSNILNTPQDQLDELKSGYYEGPESPEPITTRSLLKFNLDSITQGSTINSATLSVWNKHSYTCESKAVNLHRVTSNWNSSVTWPGRPSFEATPADQKIVSKGVACNNAGYVNFDARSIVSWWKNTSATNEGFMLKADNESDEKAWKKWASDQASNKPQLEINYEDSNRAPFVPVLQAPTNGVTVRNVSPTFSAWYEDPDDNLGYDEFQVFRAADTMCPDQSCAYRWGDGPRAQSDVWSAWTADRDLPSGQYKWRARAFDGARRSDWSSLGFFWVDAPDPPTITAHPADYTRFPGVEYSFTGKAGNTFECLLDYELPDGQKGRHSTTSPCSSPKNYQLTQDGYYTFKVAAIDPNGGGNRSPYATHSFTLDRLAPAPPAVGPSEPASPGNSRTVRWSFTGEAGAAFQCQLFGPAGPLSSKDACISPKEYTLLPTAGDGTYRIEVWQSDRAGNASTASGSGSYVLDTAPPGRPIIASRPAERTRDPAAEWRFSGEAGATFQCRLSRDGTEAYAKTPCPSTKTYTLTQDGSYTLEVWQKDQAGNESLEWETDSFVLDRTSGKPSAVRSTTHVPYVAMKARQIEMTWNAAQDDAGIDGYWWTFLSQAPDSSPCSWSPGQSFQNQENEFTAKSAEGLNAGRYWFKICAIDNLGNLGEPMTYGPLLVDPQGSPFVLSPTLPADLVAQSDGNGLEQFYPFRSFDLGHYSGYTSLDTGNLVVQATDFSVPGKGVNTVIRHAYNSGRTHAGYHDTGVGRGWTLSLFDADAGLDFAGSAIEIDLNTPVIPTFGELAGMAAGATGGILELTDGDGTVHRFTRPGDRGSRWGSPPGVDLWVRENLASGEVQSYDLIRPDGVAYRVKRVPLGPSSVSDSWHVSEVFDRNGNRLLLSYRDYGSPTDKSGPGILPKIRVERIARLAAGDAETDEVVVFEYDAGQLLAMQATPGDDALNRRRIELGYEGGYLTTVTENTEAPAGDERVSLFKYGTYEKDLVNPLDDVRLLESVQDGGGARTHFVYDDGSTTGSNRIVGICDRLDHSSDQPCDNPTTVDYGTKDPNTGVHATVVTVPVKAGTESTPAADTPTTYRISGRSEVGNGDRRIAGGNVTRITDEGSPTPIVDRFEWEQNLLLKKVDGAGSETLMHYNGLGLLTKMDSPPVNLSRSTLPANAPTGRIHTTFVYDGVEGSAFSSDACATPGSGGHAQISTDMWCDTAAETVRTTRGAASHGDTRITDFDYDWEGNLEKVFLRKESSVPLPADPDTGFAKRAGDRVVGVEHNGWGGISAVRGPRDVADDVTYLAYHDSGFPTTITDAEGNSKTFEYSDYGELLRVTDRDDRSYVMTYDHRGNLLTTEDPDHDKTAHTYDANDNAIATVAPRGYEAGNTEAQFTTATDLNPNEWPEKVLRPGATAANPSLLLTYNLDGTQKSRTNEVGAETTFSYYANRRLKEMVRPAGSGDQAVTTITYDEAGRRSQVTLPYNGSARPERRLTYAPAGTVVETAETSSLAQDRVAAFAYDAFGAQVQVLGPRGEGGVKEEQLSVYSSWGERTMLSRRATPSVDGILKYHYVYDDAGNVERTEHPTGDGASLTTTFEYDKLNRLVTQTDPQNPDHWVRYTYTAEGDQKTRSDMKDPSNVQRRIVHEYNPDHSVRSVVAEDRTAASGIVETLALCNFSGSDYDGGYDSNGNLLRSRTVKGSDPDAPCAEPDVLRSEVFEYDRRDRLGVLTQSVRLPGMGSVERSQELDYRGDGLLAKSTWAGHETTYEHSIGGVLEGVTDWRENPAAVSFDSFPAGNAQSVTIPDAATATMSYHPDGSTASLAWRGADNGDLVRRHSDITYDIGGLRKSENVSIAHPATALSRDTGGVAKFDYDLAGRLTSWTSSFRLSETVEGTDSPRTTYGLDDGGNIKVETVVANDGAGTRWIERTSDYVHSRLESKTVKTFELAGRGIDGTTIVDPAYNAIGEEKSRSTSTSIDVGAPARVTRHNSSATTYDPGGHTSKVDFAGDEAPQDVEYVYAADGQLIARTVEGKTTYFFYFASGSRHAELVRPSNVTKTRYLNSPTGSVMAEQQYKEAPVGDPVQSAPTLTWLLRDADGNVATEITADGAVASQRAYDPYGARDGGGTSKAEGHDKSDLGFQSDYTDGSTGNVAMGPRLYDPSTARFTTADFYMGATSDMALGTDPLTGNRYLFAAANPVAFFDDGHEPCAEGMDCNTTYSGRSEQQREREEASSGTSWRRAEQTSVAVFQVSFERYPGWACLRNSAASVTDYLTAIACPPHSFPYVPEIRQHALGRVAADPMESAECTGLIDTGFAWDFRDECDVHDYGSDLVKAGVISEPQKDIVDDYFHELMLADCAIRVDGQEPCEEVAEKAYWVVKFVQPEEGDSIDVDEGYERP